MIKLKAKDTKKKQKLANSLLGGQKEGGQKGKIGANKSHGLPVTAKFGVGKARCHLEPALLCRGKKGG